MNALVLSFTIATISTFISGFMAIYIAREMLMLSRMENIVRKPLFGLFLCDFLLSLQEMTMVGPSLFYHTSGNLWNTISPELCILIAAIGQISIVGISLWSTVLDGILCTLLIGFPSSRISRTAFYQDCIVWGGAFLSTSIGIGLNIFGAVPGMDAECGIIDNAQRGIFHLVPILISLVTSISVLCLCIYKCNMFRGDNAHMLIDTTAFAWAFIFVWFAAAWQDVNYLVVGGSTTNAWINVWEFMPSLSGIIDFFVWLLLTCRIKSALKKNNITINQERANRPLINDPDFVKTY